MQPVSTTAIIRIRAPQARVFAVAISTPAVDFVKPHGLVPGIAASSGATRWRTPGDTRIHTLTDGSSVDEYLTGFADGEYFAYRISGFRGPFGAAIEEGRARWRFDWRGPNETDVAWDYAFTPKSALARPALALIVKQVWPGYLKSALKRLKEIAEANP